MDQINKTIKFNKLFSIYGELLPKSQREILNQYFCYNLSISEIAIENGISRSAVEDAIKKGCKKTEAFEQILKIDEKNSKIIKNLDCLYKLCDKQGKEIIEKIKKEVK